MPERGLRVFLPKTNTLLILTLQMRDMEWIKPLILFCVRQEKNYLMKLIQSQLKSGTGKMLSTPMN